MPHVNGIERHEMIELTIVIILLLANRASYKTQDVENVFRVKARCA